MAEKSAASTFPSADAAPSGADAVPDARGLNLYRADPMLARLMPLYLPAALCAHLAPYCDRLGALAGGRLDELAAEADRHPPRLHPRTRTGEDRQSIEKHPSYREMERIAFGEFGLAAMSHRAGVFGWPTPLPPAAKYVLTYLFAQAEFGLLCPVSMTDSLTRTLRKFGDPALVEHYLQQLLSQDLETLAQGAMFMTEQGAGSDVGATAVHAVAKNNGSWQLFGDKWFCSNADAALAMVLARPEGAAAGTKGLSLFLLPRLRGDGTPNAYRIVRLKDKLGTRDMASGEIRLEGAEAFLVGEPGAGFRQMTDMINNSRLSNGVRAAGMMRRAVTEALFVAHHRRAFGRRLIELPLMRRQLLKILVPTEQARSMMFTTAEALSRADAGEEGAYALLRILTPLIKFRACRDARRVTGDAMEVRGGAGYIEEWPEPRLVRDAHLGSIWEGTSNIVALDVMRAARREGALTALRRHITAQVARSGMTALLPPLAGAIRLAEQAMAPSGAHLARRAAGALYHLASASAFACEAAELGETSRQTLADLVLRHRVLPQDPLAETEDDTESAAMAALLPNPATLAHATFAPTLSCPPFRDCATQ